MNQKKIVVDVEFQGLLVPLSTAALAELELSVRNEGCRDGLVVWDYGDADKVILLDGHNRWQIIEREKGRVKYEVIIKGLGKIPDRDAAVQWILRNQLARRNLTPGEFTLYLGKLYKEQKKQGERTDLTSAQNAQKSSGGRETTAEKIGKEHGRSAATVRRAGEVAEAVETLKADDSDIERKVASGEVSRKEIVTKAKAVSKPKTPDVPKDADGVKLTWDLEQYVLPAIDGYGQVANKIKAALAALTALTKQAPMAWDKAGVQKWQRELKSIRFEIEEARPYLACPACGDDKRGLPDRPCKQCNGRGWVSRQSAHNIPIDMRNPNREKAGLELLTKTSQKCKEVTE